MRCLRNHLRCASGFTLIELLVVILIIAILIAVSAPSFLGQTGKAQDSAAEQYLTYGYRATNTWAINHTGADPVADAACHSAAQGSYCSIAGVVGAINAVEPELSASAGTGNCAVDVASNPEPKNHIFVESANGGNLILCNDPEQRFCTLQVSGHALTHPASCDNAVVGVVGNVDPPVLGGQGSGGVTLTTTDGTWDGTPTLTYQWQSASSSSGPWSDISGETANSHLVTGPEASAGTWLRAKVTAIEGDNVGVAYTDSFQANNP